MTENSSIKNNSSGANIISSTVARSVSTIGSSNSTTSNNCNCSSISSNSVAVICVPMVVKVAAIVER